MLDHTRRLLIAQVAAIGFVLPAIAAVLREPEIWTGMNDRALKGYDAVAYHLQRKAVKGNAAYSLTWKKAIWEFSTAENRDRFAADPERWTPQYGGYCAWGIAKGRTIGINPKIFRIFDDKLYLNVNMKIHKEWLANRRVFIDLANEQWPDVLVLAR